MNKQVFAAIEERADGRCECGCGEGFTSEARGRATCDHFFGRAKAEETARTCWLIRWSCHEKKTLNQPNAAYWVRLFIAHCQFYGFEEEEKRAMDKLSWIHSKAAFAK